MSAPPTSIQGLPAVTEVGHASAAGLLPGGGAASAVIGAAIVLGIFAGVIALETRHNLWVGMVVGFLLSLVILTALHAAYVA